MAVYNPVAGSARKRRAVERLLEAMEVLGPGLIRVETHPTDTAAKIRSHLTDEVDRVFSIGGDGTVGDVAAGVAARGIPVGVLPQGTTNVLAWELGIPRSPLRALRALARSQRTVEFGSWWVDGKCVVLGVSAGFDAAIMHRTRSAMKARLGMAAVMLKGLSSVSDYGYPAMRAEWEDADGVWQSAEAHFVIASNPSRYAGPLRVFPDADPTDDLLELVHGPTRGALATVGFWTRLFSGGGRQLRAPGVRSDQARRLRVSPVGDSAAPVQVNGDEHGFLPFEANPGPRVKLLVPEAA